MLEYIKEKNVGSQVFMNQATRAFKNNQLENSDLVLLRGLRVLHKLQQRNSAFTTEHPSLTLNNENLKEIAGLALDKAFKALESEKWYNALSVFSALSDYPEVALDFEANEQRIAKGVKACLKEMHPRQAVSCLLQVQADSQRIQNSRKLAQRIMKEFSTQYKDQLAELSTFHIIKVFDKYVQHGWLISETYNSLIAAFGTKFDEFSFREVASFNANLGSIGLRQTDIIKESIKRLREFPAKEEDGAQKLPFQSVVFPILKAIVDLDLTATKADGAEETLIESLTDDAFTKQVMRGDRPSPSRPSGTTRRTWSSS